MRQWHCNCEPAGKVVHTDHVIFVKGTSWFETLSEVCFGKSKHHHNREESMDWSSTKICSVKNYEASQIARKGLQ